MRVYILAIETSKVRHTDFQCLILRIPLRERDANQITKQPSVWQSANEGGKISFKANGRMDFFGDAAVTCVDGAGGQNRTGYARLFRAALYQ